MNRWFSPDDYRIAGLCNNYALALVDVGKYQEAEEKYKRALGILLPCRERTADVANTYVNMAHLYDRLEDYGKIENCLGRQRLIRLRRINLRNGYYAYTCLQMRAVLWLFRIFYDGKRIERKGGCDL